MKKSLFATFLVALLLAGCSNADTDTWQPQTVSKDVRPYVERAIEIIDSYLAFDISGDEADTAFVELISRLEPLGITERDPEEHLTDISTVYYIELFQFDKIAELTDTELRQRRDILAYQIGEDVSGQSYPAEKDSALFDGENIPEELLNFNAPTSDAYFSRSDSTGYIITLRFDAVNGIHPSNLLQYSNSLIDILSENSECKVHVLVTYMYYNQPVFWLDFKIENNNITGSLDNNSYNDSDNGPAATINSVEDIEGALAVGAKHLGNHKIP